MTTDNKSFVTSLRIRDKNKYKYVASMGYLSNFSLFLF